MLNYLFIVDTPVRYDDAGKFESPSPDWIHNTIGLDDFELIIMTQGTLYIEYQDIQYKLSPGQFLLLPPTENCMRQGYQKSDCSFYWLHFTYKNIIQSIESNNFHNLDGLDSNQILIPAYGDLPQPQKAIVYIRQLQDYARSNYSSIMKNYLTTMILCEISHQIPIILSKNPENIGLSRQKQLYNDILNYINFNIRKNLKVNDIASHFGYNSKYLSHLFREIMGVPLKQYMTKLQMEEAAFLLTDSNATVKEISSSLGFTDSHNFMKLFKNTLGMTPSEYRNTYSRRKINYE